MPSIKQSCETMVWDEKTGQMVTKRANRTLNWGEEPQYIKLYLQDIMYLSDMPKQYAGLTMSLLKRVSYAGDEDGMCVTLIPRIKKAICKELGWKNEKSLNNALTKLVEGKILFRVDRGLYRFNPYLFGKGDWQDIGRLRLDIVYDATMKGRTFQANITYAEEKNGQLTMLPEEEGGDGHGTCLPEDVPPEEWEEPDGEECPDTARIAV